MANSCRLFSQSKVAKPRSFDPFEFSVHPKPTRILNTTSLAARDGFINGGSVYCILADDPSHHQLGGIEIRKIRFCLWRPFKSPTHYSQDEPVLLLTNRRRGDHQMPIPESRLNTTGPF
ncbi:uncharacterized protein ARMOST_12736 [Armillaria ostoyae]|uniref:Uncharacterized protein n=1 Tax=Armillaria ostoyae TaxID=47428 RepID=A0A284RKT0_ARMOS|nr:uncharacterized protein ARMOST_12736 [Armillaria ostoyae]